jgi:hypothetical protein
LEIDELEALLEAIGLKISLRRLKELMDKYDADGDGCLEIFEFVMLLRSLHQEAYLRIQEMLFTPMMALASSLPSRNGSASLNPTSMIPSFTVADGVLPYSPPETGFLHVNITDNLIHKKFYRILTSCQKEYILQVIKGVGNSNLASLMITSAVEHIKLRLEEALNFAEIMIKDSSNDKIEITRNLLFEIDNVYDASQFLHSLFRGNRVELNRLKKEFGMLLRPVVGNPTGLFSSPSLINVWI